MSPANKLRAELEERLRFETLLVRENGPAHQGTQSRRYVAGAQALQPLQKDAKADALTFRGLRMEGALDLSSLPLRLRGCSPKTWRLIRLFE